MRNFGNKNRAILKMIEKWVTFVLRWRKKIFTVYSKRKGSLYEKIKQKTFLCMDSVICVNSRFPQIEKNDFITQRMKKNKIALKNMSAQKNNVSVLLRMIWDKQFIFYHNGIKHGSWGTGKYLHSYCITATVKCSAGVECDQKVRTEFV